MPKYTVRDTHIIHDGVTYGPGDQIELTEEQAAGKTVILTTPPPLPPPLARGGREELGREPEKPNVKKGKGK